MVEVLPQVQFSNKVECNIETALTINDHQGASNHGHMPEKSLKPIFIASGLGIAHKVIDEESLLKEAPTFLKLMGIESSDLELPLDIFKNY